jgi:hypothetical protein
MRKPRLTDRIIEGLLECVTMAEGEMAASQEDESPAWTQQEHERAIAAYQWIRQMRKYRVEKKCEARVRSGGK